MMRRRTFTAGALALAAVPLGARAQQQGRMARIAYLSTSPPGDFRSRAVRQGLSEFGYVEGQNIVIDYFNAPNIAELPQFAARAVAAKPDVIVTIVTPASLAARAATTTIPIVFGAVGAPVETGLVASLGRPGGNVTGTSSVGNQVAAKRLQILQEMVAGLARVAVLVQPENQITAVTLPEIFAAGRTLGIDIQVVEASVGKDFGLLVEGAAASGAQAIQIVSTDYLINGVDEIVRVSSRFRLPIIGDFRQLPEAGGLVSYGPDLGAIYRRVGYFVDRILKGKQPADLPVEQPTTFDLIINKRTADALGIRIPETLLVFATEIIE